MIKFKTGVSAYCKSGTVRKEIWIVVELLESIFNSTGKELVITSLCDGKHSKHSKHYEGNAVDVRTRHLNDEELDKIIYLLKSRLNNIDYDIVVESTHLHIEYDPKEQT